MQWDCSPLQWDCLPPQWDNLPLHWDCLPPQWDNLPLHWDCWSPQWDSLSPQWNSLPPQWDWCTYCSSKVAYLSSETFRQAMADKREFLLQRQKELVVRRQPQLVLLLHPLAAERQPVTLRWLRWLCWLQQQHLTRVDRLGHRLGDGHDGLIGEGGGAGGQGLGHLNQQRVRPTVCRQWLLERGRQSWRACTCGNSERDKRRTG